MARQRITVAENGATLMIAPEVLHALGLQHGDEVDVSLEERSVVLRPIHELERARKIDAVTQAVMKRRKQALQQLSMYQHVTTRAKNVLGIINIRQSG